MTLSKRLIYDISNFDFRYIAYIDTISYATTYQGSHRLPLIGGKDTPPVRRESDHVGEETGLQGLYVFFTEVAPAGDGEGTTGAGRRDSCHLFSQQTSEPFAMPLQCGRDTCYSRGAPFCSWGSFLPLGAPYLTRKLTSAKYTKKVIFFPIQD